MKKEELKKLVKRLIGSNTQLEGVVEERNERLMSLIHEVGELRRTLTKTAGMLADYTVALGPLWSTQRGHRRPLGTFSDEHLRNLLNGQWLNHYPTHKEYAEGELERRRIDREHREAEKPKSRWARFIPWSS